MSRIIECPDCDSRLRIRRQREQITCPVCQAEFNGPADAQYREEQAHNENRYVDEDVVRARKESLLILGTVGLLTIVSLIAFPGGISRLLGDDHVRVFRSEPTDGQSQVLQTPLAEVTPVMEAEVADETGDAESSEPSPDSPPNS